MKSNLRYITCFRKEQEGLFKKKKLNIISKYDEVQK